jgi:hypothetical protein
MDMPGSMIALPGDEHIATPTNLPHEQVIPIKVSPVKVMVAAITGVTEGWESGASHWGCTNTEGRSARDVRVHATEI